MNQRIDTRTRRPTPRAPSRRRFQLARSASANVVVANLARRAGYPIRFIDFFRYGALVVGESMVIATLYLWVRYLA